MRKVILSCVIIFAFMGCHKSEDFKAEENALLEAKAKFLDTRKNISYPQILKEQRRKNRYCTNDTSGENSNSYNLSKHCRYRKK